MAMLLLNANEIINIASDYARKYHLNDEDEKNKENSHRKRI